MRLAIHEHALAPLHGVVLLNAAGLGGAEEGHLDGQLLAFADGLPQQGRRLIHVFGEDDGLVLAHARSLASLHIGADIHMGGELLDDDLVFMARLRQRANRIGRRCTSRHIALRGTSDFHIGRNRHSGLQR